MPHSGTPERMKATSALGKSGQSRNSGTALPIALGQFAGAHFRDAELCPYEDFKQSSSLRASPRGLILFSLNKVH